jgi:hypothetical protein
LECCPSLFFTLPCEDGELDEEGNSAEAGSGASNLSKKQVAGAVGGAVAGGWFPKTNFFADF